MSRTERNANGERIWSIAKCGVAALAMGAGIAAGSRSEAAVIYTDAPDVTLIPLASLPVRIDLNADGAVDFDLLSQGGCLGTDCIPMRFTLVGDPPGSGPPHGRVAVDGSAEPFGSYAAALTSGADVPDALTFEVSAKLGDERGGPWTGAGRSFVGLAFDIGGSTHYGWARLEVASPDLATTLFDYAYESCPGQSITAGSTLGGATCGSSVPTPSPIALLAAGAGAVLALRRLTRESSEA